MKKLIFAALILLQMQAYATKARVQALAYSGQLTDEQYVFNNVLYANYLGNFVALESGAKSSTSATTSASNAEGMAGYKLNDKSSVVFSMGHQDAQIDAGRILVNALGTSYVMTQNPLHTFYGVKTDSANYGFGMSYSNMKDKLTDATESSSGLSLGTEIGPWQFYGNYTLVNSVETAAGGKFDGAGAGSLNVYYTGENIHSFLNLNEEIAKSASAGIENESHIVQVVHLGLLETQQKDGNDIFWGAQIVTVLANCRVTASVACDKKYSSTKLPVWIGFETQEATWLTLRGSITQSVLLSQSKDEVGYPAGLLEASTGAVSEFSAGPNNTTVAAGIGFNFRNFNIDGTLSTATTQVLNAGNFIGQVGMKYNF
ncbi:MAG: hypothetical protein ACXWQQ_15535 [Pseudobdellovibrio sp.]